MNFDDLLRAFLDICPNGEIGEDLDGQLVFYTGMELLPSGNVAWMDEDENQE